MQNRHTDSQSGFTLMELLIVLIILGMLASIAVPQAVKDLGRAKTDTAQLQVQALSMNLDFYKIDVGQYPSQEEGLKALINKPANVENWLGPYVKKSASLIDPWGEPYLYKISSENSVGENSVEILSMGADKKTGGTGDNKDVSSTE
jgi:general secretion pathway protein G